MPTKSYHDGWKPEPELYRSAKDMLDIVFNGDSSNDEAEMAATTLVEIVAPMVLPDAPDWSG